MSNFKTIEVSNISEIPSIHTEPTIYKFKIDDNLSLSGLFSIKPNPENIIIFFNGAIRGELSSSPYFMRWSWAYEQKLSFICFDDPVVSCTQLTNIGWYVGTAQHDLQHYINLIISNIISSLNIGPNKVFFYGSSGGGFASLIAATRLRGSVAIACNPQTNVFNYHKNAVQKFTSNFFGNTNISPENDIYYRFCVLHSIKKFDYIPNIIYVQNIQDKFHLEKHFFPLQSLILTLLSAIGDYPNKLHTTLFNDQRGHGAISGKEEFINEINHAINLDNEVSVYPSMFNINKNILLSENISWYELQDNHSNFIVSFELDIEGKTDGVNPVIFLIDNENIDHDTLKNHGFSYSNSLGCLFKYIPKITPGEIIEIHIHKSLKTRRIGFRKWNCNNNIQLIKIKTEATDDYPSPTP